MLILFLCVPIAPNPDCLKILLPQHENICLITGSGYVHPTLVAIIGCWSLSLAACAGADWLELVGVGPESIVAWEGRVRGQPVEVAGG